MNLMFLIPSIGQLYVLIIVTLFSYMFTYLTTHHPLFNLPQIEMFNRKPFSCWLCSNFWFNMFLIPSIWQLYLLIIITMFSYMFTYLTTHHPMFNLPQIEMFNRKPFSCWLCSNFWFNMFLMVNISYLWTPMFLIWGLIFTGLTTYVIYHDGY